LDDTLLTAAAVLAEESAVVTTAHLLVTAVERGATGRVVGVGLVS